MEQDIVHLPCVFRHRETERENAGMCVCVLMHVCTRARVCVYVCVHTLVHALMLDMCACVLCVYLCVSGLGSGRWGNSQKSFHLRNCSCSINSNGIILFFNVFVYELSASVLPTCKLDHILSMVCFQTQF